MYSHFMRYVNILFHYIRAVAKRLLEFNVLKTH